MLLSDYIKFIENQGLYSIPCSDRRSLTVKRCSSAYDVDKYQIELRTGSEKITKLTTDKPDIDEKPDEVINVYHMSTLTYFY